MSGQEMWWVTLGVGALVVAVVALLLSLVVSTAARIRGALEQVWVAGPGIADNTAHLDLLRRVNLVAGDIVDRARRIAAHAARIQEHADGCAGCPHCVVGWGGGAADAWRGTE